MSFDDRFGDFLVFRRLGSSALGSSLRAGRLQARAVDRVVLLLCFDGETVDRSRLVADTSSRTGVLRQLTAPQFANGLDMGSEEGVPYVAYDYLLGRTLRQLLERAAKRGVGLDPTYLVALTEQATANLIAAQQRRLDGIPIRHGFLVPELLLLSAEGRVVPLAFPHGPALARQKPLRQLFAPYLAPETRSGDVELGDEVYSLAAFLFEALVGRPLDPEDSTATQVDQALFTGAGRPMPPTLQNLLKNALSAADTRPSLKSFRRELRRVLENEEQAPSQFQLAFFLHQLFREELEAEAVEMREEKTSHFDPLLLTPTDFAAPDEVESPPAVCDEGIDEGEATRADAVAPVPAPPPASRLTRHPFFSGALIALVIAITAAGALQMTRRGVTAVDSGQATTPTAAAERPPEVETELRRLVEEGAEDLQQRLEDEYQPRLARLRQDVLDARSRSGPRQPLPAARATTVEQRSSEPTVGTRPEPAPEPPVLAATTPAMEPAAAGPDEVTEPAQPVDDVSEAVEATVPPPSATAGSLSDEPPDLDSTSTERPTESVADPSAEEAAEEPGRDEALALSDAPVPAEIDLTPPGPVEASTLPSSTAPAEIDPTPPTPVEASAPPSSTAPAEIGPTPPTAVVPPSEIAYSRPQLLEQPRPRFPPVAQRLGKTARVQVRVLVDADGRVAETALASEPAGFGFDKAALQAATETKWSPAQRDGTPVSAWAVLTIDFRL